MPEDNKLTPLGPFNYQINQLISDSEYIILHPETNADMVIETDDRKWLPADWKGTLMRYKGSYETDETYIKNDLVEYGNQFYVCVSESASGLFNEDDWNKLNKLADVATIAKTVETTKVDDADVTAYPVTFVDVDGNILTGNITYTRNTDTLTVTNLKGTAEFAEKYMTNAKEATETSAAVPSEPKRIADKFDEIEKDIADIIGGEITVTLEDLVLVDAQGNQTIYNGSYTEFDVNNQTLTISRKEDGVDVDHTFDASENVEIAIEELKIVRGSEELGTYNTSKATEIDIANKTLTINQNEEEIANYDGSADVDVTAYKLAVQKNGNEIGTFAPLKEDSTINVTIVTKDVTDLLDSNDKIKEIWLPDTILGQLSYKGTWNPAVAGTAEPDTGDYYIAEGTGRYWPDGSSLDASITDFLTGDWAVYNGTSWNKIDNTDAVTMVNGQIGSVKTYKGNWTANTQYFQGDIVKYDGILFVANKNSQAATFNEADWDQFGALYEEVTGNPVKVNNETYTIEHAKIGEEGTTTETEVGNNSTIVVPTITKDEYGHIVKVDNTEYTLKVADVDTNTVREIQVNGETKLTVDSLDSPLNVVNGNYTNAVYENDALKINHNTVTVENVNGTDVNLNNGGEFTTVVPTVDAYGHVTKLTSTKQTLPTIEVLEGNVIDVTVSSDKNSFTVNHEEVTHTTTTGTAQQLDHEGKFSIPVPSFDDYGHIKDITTTEYTLPKGYELPDNIVDQSANIYGGKKQDGSDIIGTWREDNLGWDLGDSGALSADATDPTVYSAVSVNKKGIVVAGGQILEFGTEVNADPSASLAVGGLFFRKLSE